jgi:hypothetical protein
MKTGKDINEYHENWDYSLEHIVNNILYQSNNLEDLLDIKDTIIQANKYNI